MPTEAQGIRTLTAWEELIQALEESGDDDLQVVRDLRVLCGIGGPDVHVSIFREIHERAEVIRQALRRCEVDK